MAVTSADLEQRYSVKTGSAGDSTASTAPASLGKYMATTEIASNVNGNVFTGAITPASDAIKTFYRCFFFVNTNASDTWQSVRVWIPSQLSGGGTVAIGLDPAGVVDHDTAAAQAEEIADEETAPSGVTFAQPTADVNGLVVGNVGPEQCFAVWARLTVPAQASALGGDNCIFAARSV